MGQQIICQPDGRLAVWSSVVDDWIVVDASADEIADRAAVDRARDARVHMLKMAAAVEAGEARKVYFQFAMTFDEAQARRLERHGEAPWPLSDVDTVPQTWAAGVVASPTIAGELVVQLADPDPDLEIPKDAKVLIFWEGGE